jgi:hypothetical protein
MRCVLASGKKRANPLDLSAENAELNRDVISTLAHELGGIASALDLRAAAMARSIPEQDLGALREIAEEVRMATRAARFARGLDGSGMLNPMRRQSLDEWWRLSGRFTASVLPRGVAVEPSFGDLTLTAEQASILTWIWLAGCKELSERGLTTPTTVSLTAERSATDDPALVAETPRDSFGPGGDGSPGRWSRYAAKLAKVLGVGPPEWHDEDGTLRWRIRLPAEPGSSLPARDFVQRA